MMEHSTSAGRHTRSTVSSQLHTHLGGVLLVVDLDAGQARLEAIQRRRRVSGHGGRCVALQRQAAVVAHSFTVRASTSCRRACLQKQARQIT